MYTLFSGVDTVDMYTLFSGSVTVDMYTLFSGSDTVDVRCFLVLTLMAHTVFLKLFCLCCRLLTLLLVVLLGYIGAHTVRHFIIWTHCFLPSFGSCWLPCCRACLPLVPSRRPLCFYPSERCPSTHSPKQCVGKMDCHETFGVF